MQTTNSFFIILYSAVALFDLILAVFTFKRGGYRSRTLGFGVLSVLAVTVTYMLFALAPDEHAAFIASTVYFILMDIMLMLLDVYSHMASTHLKQKKLIIPHFIIVGLGIADIAVLAANIFSGFAFEIVGSSTYGFVKWVFDYHTLMYVHFAYNLLVFAYIVFILIVKISKVAAIFRQRFLYALIVLFVVLFIKSSYVFTDSHMFDISIMGYSGIALFYFVSDFGNSKNAMMRVASTLILDDINYPMVLFDDINRFALCNKEGVALVPEEKQNSQYLLKDFVKDMGMDPKLAKSREDATFHWNHDDRAMYRCDMDVLKDDEGKLVGKIFVFIENSMEVDLLTGFTFKQAAEARFSDKNFEPEYPVAVMSFDINKLGYINKMYERNAGDKAVRALAESIKRACPENAHFVRLDDAVLAAVCEGMSLARAREIQQEVADAIYGSDILPEKLVVQSAVSMVKNFEMTVREGMMESFESLKLRKMLDSGSAHSSLLDSLAMTQTVSDFETEEHVKRTRYLADKLGQRMEVSDNELNQLSLLCLLHDIGKIGIPLEILNKPGKLNPAEWEVMKSHVVKGCKIAGASAELKDIADAILHHHESWDGSGYPDGLVGVAIPILSRINAVVDTFDAITNDRPYRPASSIATAVAELKRGAGIQFDPVVVAQMIELLVEEYGEEIVEKGAEELTVRPVITEAERVWKDVLPIGNVYPLEHARYYLDENARVTDIDQAFTGMTGYTVEDLQVYDLHQKDLLPLEDQGDYLKLTEILLKGDDSAYMEHRLRARDGTLRNVLCFGRLYYDAAAGTRKSEVIIADIGSSHTYRESIAASREATKANMSRMEDMMRRDGQTGLFLRKAFQAEVDQILLNENHQVVIMMMDIDKFKEYNDTYGHSYGDEVIRAVAASIKNSLDEGEFAARVGGDEFSLCMSFDTGKDPGEIEEHIKNTYMDICDNIHRDFPDVTLSAGAANSTQERYSFMLVYNAADSAMYEIKNSTRNNVCCDVR